MTLTYDNASETPQGNGLNGRMLIAALIAALALVAWFSVCAILHQDSRGYERSGRGVASASKSSVLWYTWSRR